MSEEEKIRNHDRNEAFDELKSAVRDRCVDYLAHPEQHANLAAELLVYLKNRGLCSLVVETTDNRWREAIYKLPRNSSKEDWRSICRPEQAYLATFDTCLLLATDPHVTLDDAELSVPRYKSIPGHFAREHLTACEQVGRYVASDERLISRSARNLPTKEIEQAAETYKIPTEMIQAVIAATSQGSASYRSSDGRLGLMPLPITIAKAMYVSDPLQPTQSILGGARYLRFLANQFDGDMLLVLAGYHSGVEEVKRYRGLPPDPAAAEFVRQTTRYYFELKQAREWTHRPSTASQADTER